MIRYIPFAIVVALCILSLLAPLAGSAWLLLLAWPLLAIGAADLLQQEHSLRRNYPVVGHLRMLAESIRPQVQQYFVESDIEGKPYDRQQRSLIYQRSKNAVETHPFGTERDVTRSGYEWVNHSMAPRAAAHEPPRVRIGESSAQPYDSALLNVSAMSFGSLSAAAIEALSSGAAQGGFAHDTGEGAISPYHERGGADLIWELGTGYYGARSTDGGFDAGLFKDKAALPQVKMIEIKLSQGAKPGHGGILPAAKVTAEIAQTRGIPVGQECISPAYHRAFDTPRGLLQFVAQLRELSGGKPVGFKLCIGHRWEFMAICKAMLDTGIRPDFIVIDGKEGGTGAAPVEFTDHVGTPLRDGLLFARNALVGCDLKSDIRLGAAGKVATGFDMAVMMALGADWCNAARAFMFALGCLQSQHCHTNHCPVGIATQDPLRQKGLDVTSKAVRVAAYQAKTVQALQEITAAAGLEHPHELQPYHFFHRTSSRESVLLSETYPLLEPGALVAGDMDAAWQKIWARASADSFARVNA
ncbi:MAG: FMN-binding glutamate synthase family protein [Pseudomonadales bacterium]